MRWIMRGGWAGLLLLLACAASFGQATAPASYVWWEAENPQATNFSGGDFSPRTFAPSRQLLSGGDWLSASGRRGGLPMTARWMVDVPESGSYHLWTRKFWKHGPFQWRFQEQPWRICGADCALADSVELKQFVCANWVFLGDVTLEKGPRRFDIQLLAKAGEAATAAFDCFILSGGAFVPNGQHPPGYRGGQAEEGYFAYEPPLDAFDPAALLDLRYLNEPAAGHNGPLRVVDGHLATADGKPARLWGVNVGGENLRQDRASIDYLARKLAKSGVNWVRIHTRFFDPDAADLSTIAPERIDELHYFVAAMKGQGIYCSLSFYFPLWLDVKPRYALGDYSAINNKKPFGLLFISPQFQAIHRAWAKALLTSVNPYTHLPLAADAALAMVEIVNEDSLFFWTFNRKNVPPDQWRQLDERYREFQSRQVPGQNSVALLEIWHLTGAALAKADAEQLRQAQMQTRFLAQLQHDYYRDTRDYLKNELGCKSLIVAGNWTTADPARLDAPERWSYSAADVADRHGYFEARHQGEGAGWSVRAGHTVEDRAAVLLPEALPLRGAMVRNMPNIQSELQWTRPNRFRADATFLTAALSAIQGRDGVCWFAVGSNYLRDTPGWKFALGGPMIFGAFPAAALSYRRGDVAMAAPAAEYVLPEAAVWSLRPIGADSAALDKLRQGDAPPTGGQRAAGGGLLDPLAWYAGPVWYEFSPAPAKQNTIDLRGRIERAAHTIGGPDQALQWDYAKGLALLRTSAAQGAAGFLARGGAIALPDATVQSDNEYGAIWLVALDDLPLSTSRRVLVQMISEEKFLGERIVNQRIEQLGAYPPGMKRLATRLTFSGQVAAWKKCTRLDENGYAAGAVALEALGDGGQRLTLWPEALYLILER